MVAAVLTALTIASPPAAHAQTAGVRVRVQKEKPGIEVTGLGLRISDTSPLKPVAMVADERLVNAKITRNDKKGVWIVRYRDSGESVRIRSDKLNVRGQLLRVGLDPVPYDLEIHPNPKKGLDVVAKLDLETYIAGVLPSEMPASWPLEALKAQAIAARSFALRTAFERRKRYFDVDSTVMDQVYKFLHEAETQPDWKENVSRAVRETRGEILTDPRGRILKAFYSADCGCQSEDPKWVWGKMEAFQSVKDPSCKQRKPTTWELSLSRSEVRGKLLAALELPEETNLHALHVGARTPSGRVAEVLVSLQTGDETKRVVMNSQQFRKLIGFDRLRSTAFSLRWIGDQLLITGTGLGHGVGLCQLGARALAEEGMNYRDILKLYYPKANLRGGRGTSASQPRSNEGRRSRELSLCPAKSNRRSC